MVHIPVNVSRDKEIKLAVSVVIAEGGTGGPVSKCNARSFGYIGKRAVVIIVVEAILPVIGDVDVGPAIIVIVADRYAKTPAIVGNSGLFRDIGECSVVIIMKKRGVRRLDFASKRVER